MIKAIIFDFDGLITDTESLWYEAYRSTFEQVGGNLPVTEWVKCVGTSFQLFDPFVYLSEQLGQTVDRTALERNALEKYQLLADTLEVRPGVENYLQDARSMGLHIGLSSSSSREWVESYLRRFELFHYFEAISTSDNVERIKPEPDLYLRTMSLLNVTGDEAFALEDSLNGLKAARAAGLPCVIVPNAITAHLPFVGEAYRLSSLEDMPLQALLKHLKE